jgi:glycerol-3-phosphate dehydrogenase (NAD(P)+)
VCIAANDLEFAKKIQNLFHSPVFRTYICDDIIGAQIGGALKNVIAISTGVSDGLNFGANSRAALITRGLVEIQRLGVKLGANPQTFMGLTGMGDLVLTCTDNQSRNRRFGLYLGQGSSIKDAMEKVQQVVEGYETVKTAKELAHKMQVEMPITDAIYNILYNDIPAKDAVMQLLSRQAKSEF